MAEKVGDRRRRPLNDGMLGALRGMNTKSEINSPDLFADVVWQLGLMDSPPLRLPIGADSEAFLEPAYDARRREYDQVIKDGHHTVS
ncbi:hypothetical protein O7634_21700 [Micromonospora sp. WMMD1120]|uniref:hypothetical protein n=1 Tax=Micromonospora sp. WMMD1120 TaxID=3016106 RepID=UPI002416D011|nr:hypothetical protein [Micromonospora sp. WMMD1120]MDG4809369.1 hypothetical protein [Micromonospora sp. WMMD1120]